MCVSKNSVVLVSGYISNEPQVHLWFTYAFLSRLYATCHLADSKPIGNIIEGSSMIVTYRINARMATESLRDVRRPNIGLTKRTVDIKLNGTLVRLDRWPVGGASLAVAIAISSTSRHKPTDYEPYEMQPGLAHDVIDQKLRTAAKSIPIAGRQAGTLKRSPV